jgi:hypothetical protein
MLKSFVPNITHVLVVHFSLASRHNGREFFFRRQCWGFIITGFKVHNGSSLPAALGMAGDGWG